MAVTEPHLGCAYHTPEGDAICVGIVPGIMVFELSWMAVETAKREGRTYPEGRFEVPMSDDQLVEVFCSLKR